ncbi:MAG: zf-HC2 domain-containing protein [Longimicrobiales bacterium]|nr:zf-HC2 domain-containing protein [Longimicrobiales bacterium]
MSHVDEGALHAYLDGALDALPASESDRIREHLASCDACARRLEEERALRAEAQAILAGADPGVGALPSLEELRQRADARARPRPGLRLHRLTWAASIVVAVGAGWMLRGSQAPRFSDALESPRVEQPRAAEVPPEEAAVSEEEVAEQGAAGAGAVPAKAPGAAASGPARTELAGEEASAARPETAAELDVPPPAAPPASFQAARERPEEELQKALQAGRGMVARVLADSSAGGVAPPSPSVTSALRSDEARESVMARHAAQGPRLQVVPGFAVVSVEQGDASLPAGAVRVLQLVEGDTLELVHLPGGTTRPSLPDVGPDGKTQVVVGRGSGWLVGRARMPREALELLLGRVSGGG